MSDEEKKQQVTFEAMNYLCFQPQTSRMLHFFMVLTLSKQGKVFVWIFVSNFVYFSRFREKLGVKTVKALKRNNNSVTHAAIDMLCALMCVSKNSVTRYLCLFKHTVYYSVLSCSVSKNLCFCSLQPMHDDYDLRQEQLNKASLLSSKKFLENLLEKFITNVVNTVQSIEKKKKSLEFIEYRQSTIKCSDILLVC